MSTTQTRRQARVNPIHVLAAVVTLTGISGCVPVLLTSLPDHVPGGSDEQRTLCQLRAWVETQPATHCSERPAQP